MKSVTLHIIVLLLFIGTEITAFSQNTITIQPTDEDGKDAFIRDLAPDVNFSFLNEIPILAWTYSGSPMITHGLVDFDLTSIPSGATITCASLSLFNNPVAQSGGEHSQMNGSNAMFVDRVTSAWDEQTITWNTQPSTTTLHRVSVPASTSPHQDYVIDVTELVQDMIDNPSSSFGFRLKLQTEIYYRRVIFASCEYIDPAKHPMIEICYDIENGIIDGNHSSGDITIYPNPASDKVTISNLDVSNETQIAIYNSQGSKVFETKLAHRISNELDLSELSNGIYFARLQTDKHSQIKKFVIQK